MRTKAKKLRVTWKGHVYDQGDAVDTFQHVICEIVCDRGLVVVKGLGLCLSGELLIQIGASTAIRSRDCGAFHLATHSDTDEKAEVLRRLQRALDLDMEVVVLSPAEQITEAVREVLA
jgi:hypothetical protein